MHRGPTFFIIGAAKAGTTSLATLLAAHPHVGLSRIKEPHFFSVDSVFAVGWQQYLTLYDHCADAIAIGDASTSYSRLRYFPLTLDRIERYVPQAKFIYMVRHPLDRMVSAYIEHLAKPGGHFYKSINEAVRRLPMIVDSSRYWETFSAYCHRFGQQNVMVVWFEEYVNHLQEVFQEVCRFLEIDDSIPPNLAMMRMNTRRSVLTRAASRNGAFRDPDTRWSPDTQLWVEAAIRTDIDRFLEHFGRPMDYWAF